MMSRRFLPRLATLAAGLAGLGLLGFHAALFWGRVADATIQHPAVLARWIGSGLLIAGFLAIRRYGAARHATFAFWVAVLLLHIFIPADQRQLSADETIAFIVQTAAVTIAVAFARLFSVDCSPNFAERLTVNGKRSTRLQVLRSSASPRSPPHGC